MDRGWADHWLAKRMYAAGSAPALLDTNGGLIGYAELLDRAQHWALAARSAPPGAVAFAVGGFEGVAAILGTALAGRVALSLATVPPSAQVDVAARAGARQLYTATGWVPVDASVPDIVANAPSGGVVLFSSGSTGRPKGVMYLLDALIGRYQRTRAPRRRLTVFPVDHVGGLSLMFHTLASGGSLVFVEHPAQPSAVATAVATLGVEVLVASPTFLRMALLADVDLGPLDQIVWSSEPMPTPTARAVHARWPNVALIPSYGLTELGVLPTQSRPGHPDWVRLNVEHRVVEGRLWLRSAMPMAGYLDGAPAVDADGWYDTGDRVETEGPYLRVLGRETDVINVGGAKVLPLVVEEALLSLPNITGARAEARPNVITGQVVVATVTLAEPEPEGALRERVASALRGQLPPAAVPVWVSVAPRLEWTSRLKLARTGQAQ